MKTTFKFTIWLVTFAIAYFIQATEVVSLSYAFFGLHVTLIGASILSLLLAFAFGKEPALQKYSRLFIKLLRFGVAIGITSILSWIVATLFLKIDFFNAYLLTTLGQCMYNIDYTEDINLPKFGKNKKAATIAEKKQTAPYIPTKYPQTVPEELDVDECTPDVVEDLTDDAIVLDANLSDDEAEVEVEPETEVDSEVDADDDIEIEELDFNDPCEEEKAIHKFNIDIPL